MKAQVGWTLVVPFSLLAAVAHDLVAHSGPLFKHAKQVACAGVRRCYCQVIGRSRALFGYVAQVEARCHLVDLGFAHYPFVAGEFTCAATAGR